MPDDLSNVGRIRKITNEEGTVDYILEFPTAFHFVPDYPPNILVSSQAGGLYPTKAVPTEWEQVSLIQLIHTLTRR